MKTNWKYYFDKELYRYNKETYLDESTVYLIHDKRIDPISKTIGVIEIDGHRYTVKLGDCIVD